MGLLLMGGMLIIFYILKLVCPQFIVGVAEIPSVVKLGNFIDSHLWAYYLFDSFIGFLSAYIYCCACCRKSKLSIKGLIIVFCSIILLKLVVTFIPQQYNNINYVVFLITPFICCLADKNISKSTLMSIILCFSIDILSQVMSMLIRDITTMTIHLNSATFYILLIDAFIWRFLLYFYFNYKVREEKQ